MTFRMNTEYLCFILIVKIAVKREDAVTREMSRKLAEDKKMSRKEKDERYLSISLSSHYSNIVSSQIITSNALLRYVLTSLNESFNS